MIKKTKNKISVAYKEMRAGLRYLSVFRKPKSIARPRIIFCCDGLFSHGGLLDRMKGIISFYEVSKQLGYDFYIYFSDPFQLDEFLEPNVVSWKIPLAEMNFSFFDTKIWYRMNVFDCHSISEIKKATTTNYLVYANVDFLATLHPQNSQQDNERLWRDNFNELFRKTSLLANELVSLPQVERLVFHLRFTSLMGDFKDTTQKVLNAAAQTLLIQEIRNKMDAIANQYPHQAIYVLSDSYLFLEYIQKKTPYAVLAGQPVHIDFTNKMKASNKTHLKTFSDFFFMVESDTIIMLRLQGMYSSSFSRYAAILGNKRFLIIQS